MIISCENSKEPCRLIILIGLPASGKSTMAETLSETYNANIYSSDETRIKLFNNVNACSKEENAKVFDYMHSRMISDIRKGKSCIYDATNLSRGRRIKFLKMFERYNVHKEAILFLRTPEWCEEKNKEREKAVPDGVIKKMLCNFNMPDYYEGWNNIEINCLANNEKPFHIPYEEFDDFDQSNHHHMLSLGEHIKRTVEFLKPFEDENLILAGHYHDCGKYYTKGFFNLKGEPTEEAHYYGHDNYSAYLTLCDLFFNYSNEHDISVEDIIKITQLVNWHMKPYLDWKDSEDCRKRDREMIGRKLFRNVMLLNKADLSAH